MAFNKVSMVVFVLLVVAATSHPRPDVFEESPTGLGQVGRFCSSCECNGALCIRFDQKIGSCPFSCGVSCPCTRSNPPICSCNHRVETCNPRACRNAQMTQLDQTVEIKESEKLKNSIIEALSLLGYKKVYV